MFRCTSCQVSALPGIKPVIVPAEERVKEYHGYDIEDNPTVTFGQETVREAQLCPGCAGTNVTVPRNIAAYAGISAPAINAVLSEPQVHNGRLSIAGLLLDAAARRTYHDTKRAKADYLHAFAVLKAFETRGGVL